MSGHVIAYAGDLNFYHNILNFFAGGSNSIKKKREENKTKKRELNSDMHNELKLSKKSTSV